jgi:hypothetical protein
MESDGLTEATVSIKDEETSIGKLRFDLKTVANDALLLNVPLSEIYGLDIGEDLILNELYKRHVLKESLDDKCVEELADSVLSKMWNCEDSIAFATSLRTHGQNFGRIALRSIGGRDPTDVRSVVSQFQHLFKKGWTNAVRARVTAGLTQGSSSNIRERPKRIWSCPYCTFVNETMCERCKICNEARVKDSSIHNNTNEPKKKRKETKKKRKSEDLTPSTNKRSRKNSSTSSSSSGDDEENQYDVFVRRVRWHFRTSPSAFDEFASTLSSFKIGRITQVEEACNRIRVLLRNSKGLMKDFRHLVLES